MTSSRVISSTSDFIMPDEPMVQKRPYNGRNYGEPPAKKPAASIRVGGSFKWNLQALATAADAVESGGKSPVSALNELGVRISYSLLRQGGPAHCPIFTVALKVADMTFEGWGHSKRDARATAARSCLSALLARAGRILPAHTQPVDFTSDLSDKFTVSEFQCLEASLTTKPTNVNSTPTSDMNTDVTPEETVSLPDSPTSISPSTALFGGLPAAPTFTKSPINLLYENYPGLSFLCSFGDGSPLNGPQAPLQLSHSMRFKVVCQIKEQIFEGYGSSKKLAKLAAARAALAVLSDGRVECPSDVSDGALPQTLADHVSKLVNEKFNELMKDDLTHSKRKVLAGIVLTIDNKTEGAKVIAVTTGTKCVSGEHMSVRGRAVNDSHAEVAARRCLQRYLYAQLLKYASQPNPCVSIPDSDLEPVPGGGYQMKPNRHLHLYVSTAPCGDGRIFSPHEPNEPAPDRHPNRQARGQLRTKIESGEGTIPVKNCTNIVQTWDGVMQGERLLTMSCSDKVARWCVVGLQGALLSRLIRPVYLHSLVLGSLLHHHHMYRALCGRIEGFISLLPPPFRLHKPVLARAASTEARTPARAPSFSVCWSVTAPIPEVLNAMTGKLESGQPSLLCKQSMFARWQHLMRRLPPLKEELTPQQKQLRIDENLLYNEAKQLCPTYQEAKSRLFDAFERAKLGRWIKKPQEQDQFSCELMQAEPRFLFAWAGDARAYSMQTPGPRGLAENIHGGHNGGQVTELVDNVDLDKSAGKTVDIKSVIDENRKGIESKIKLADNVDGVALDKSAGTTVDIKSVRDENRGVESKDTVSVEGIDHIKTVDFKVASEGSVDDLDVGCTDKEIDGYHKVNVASSIDRSHNLVDDRVGLQIDLHNASIKYLGTNNLKSVGDISNGKVEVRLNESHVKTKSKYLEFIKRRCVKHSDGNNDFSNDKTNNSNHTNDTKNISANDKPTVVEKKVHKNIHRSLDKNMEQLKYLYFQEAENFWNCPKYKNYTSNIEALSSKSDSNINITDIDAVTEVPNNINDLVLNLKGCNLQHDYKSQHTCTTNAIDIQTKEVNLQKSTNSKLNKIIARKTKYAEDIAYSPMTYQTNTNESSVISNTEVYETNNIDVDLNLPNSAENLKRTQNQFEDEKGEIKCYNSQNCDKTYHTKAFYGHDNFKSNDGNADAKDFDTDTSTSNDIAVGDINKENFTSNVDSLDIKHNLIKVVGTDDGRIRSTLLRKLDLSKKS